MLAFMLLEDGLVSDWRKTSRSSSYGHADPSNVQREIEGWLPPTPAHESVPWDQR